MLIQSSLQKQVNFSYKHNLNLIKKNSMTKSFFQLDKFTFKLSSLEQHSDLNLLIIALSF